MQRSLLTILRAKDSSTGEFRKAADTLSLLLASQVAAQYEEKQSVITPLTETTGWKLSTGITIVPVLRAGLAMLPAFLTLFTEARVGLIGIKRDEETAKPDLHYSNLPPLDKTTKILILDPMLATAGSAIAAIELICNQGVLPENIMVACILAAPEGKKRLLQAYPHLNVKIVHEDDHLNDKNYIVPGLGDFGDRYFGTS